MCFIFICNLIGTSLFCQCNDCKYKSDEIWILVDNDLNLANSTTNALLFQNVPNPFYAKTEIKYFVPDEVQEAFLFISNMQGALIKTINVYNRGNASVTINGTELKAGMYLYSLVADGKEVDTKRMILTE